MTLEWVDASRADIGKLHSFRCSDEADGQYTGARMYFHRAKWELEVQSFTRDYHPPYRPPDYLILGMAEKNIAAAVRYRLEDDLWEIQTLAREVSHRGQGVGDEALAETMRRIDSASSSREAIAAIHLRNRASRGLFARAGWVAAYQGRDPDYEVWTRGRR